MFNICDVCSVVILCCFSIFSLFWQKRNNARHHWRSAVWRYRSSGCQSRQSCNVVNGSVCKLGRENRWEIVNTEHATNASLLVEWFAFILYSSPKNDFFAANHTLQAPINSHFLCLECSFQLQSIFSVSSLEMPEMKIENII